MLKIMIVDDDILVRERLRSAIPFEQLGLKLCGEAENGIQALEVFEQHHPQIVIMDINIPLINGLDVAKKILAEEVETNIIIITAYGTLDFARTAIRGGMVDFMLKPVDFWELETILKRIINKVQTQSQKMMEYQRMERLLEKGMPLLRNRYFFSLMHTASEKLNEEECRLHLRDFEIAEDVNEIGVVIVVPNYNNLTVEQQMVSQAVLEEELVKSLNLANIGSVVLYDSMQRMLLVVYSSQPHLAFSLEQKISNLRDKMRYVYHLDFRASIGTVVNGFSHLQESLSSAEHALSFWSIAGNNNIVSSENVKNIDLPVAKLPAMRHSEITDLLLTTDVNRIKETICSGLKELAYETRNSVRDIQTHAIELLALVMNCARELGGDVNHVLNEEPTIYVKVLQSNNVRGIIVVVEQTVEKVAENICGQRDQNKSRALGDAKRYIRQHYTDPELTLTEVAAHIDLSPSYVSQLFKRMDSCTFTEYLNHVRIEEAKHLLKTTHMRVYEIAEAVGYQNSKYFFQLFKQITGKRPREYYENAAGQADSGKD